MIITSNNTIFLETQKEVSQIDAFHWSINKFIGGDAAVLVKIFLTVNSEDFCVYELT